MFMSDSPVSGPGDPESEPDSLNPGTYGLTSEPVSLRWESNGPAPLQDCTGSESDSLLSWLETYCCDNYSSEVGGSGRNTEH